jgi:hypothetical protein
MKGMKMIALATGAAFLMVGASLTGFAAGGESPARQGADAYAPQAHAQASVRYDGTYTRVKGFTDITHPNTDQYCLKLPRSVDPDSYVAVVTPDYAASPNSFIGAQWRSDAADCPSKRWLQVLTFDLGGGAHPASEGFSVVVP